MAKPKPPAVLPLFSRRMAKYRAAAGLDFKQLEKLTGITDQTLINVERLGRSPSVAYAVKIARALGVSIADLAE